MEPQKSMSRRAAVLLTIWVILIVLGTALLEGSCDLPGCN